MINAWLGLCERNGTVYYVHGNPIYSHSKDDRNCYRFALDNLVVSKLCTIAELCAALGEHRKKSVIRQSLSRARSGLFFWT